jgi:hypothetical protein
VDREIVDKVNRARLLADMIKRHADSGEEMSNTLLDLLEALVDVQTGNVTRYKLNLEQDRLTKPNTNNTKTKYRYASVLPIGRELDE